MRKKEVVGLRAGETESLGNSETETSCIKNAYSEKKYVNWFELIYFETPNICPCQQTISMIIMLSKSIGSESSRPSIRRSVSHISEVKENNLLWVELLPNNHQRQRIPCCQNRFVSSPARLAVDVRFPARNISRPIAHMADPLSHSFPVYWHHCYCRDNESWNTVPFEWTPSAKYHQSRQVRTLVRW